MSPVMNQYLTSLRIERPEVKQHSRDASMFWVTFPLGPGWAITSLVGADTPDEAEKIARQTIGEKWPQWKRVL